MTGNEYQKLASRTMRMEMLSDDIVRHAVFGLCSEAGEVAGIFQKSYQGFAISDEHLQKELGDCLWMIAELCTICGWKLEDIMQMNIDKLKERYPDGFDVEHSLHRKKGDI